MTSQEESTAWKLLDKVIEKRKETLSKLIEEYEAVLETNTAPLDSDTELKVLYAKHIKLMAEIEVMKASKPELLPDNPAILFESAKHTLIKNQKEKTIILSQLDSMKREAVVEQLSCSQEFVNIEVDPLEGCASSDQIEELLEDEICKSEVLQGLYRKLTRRLKRLSHSYLSTRTFPEDNSNQTLNSSVGQQKSFYKVLKEFIVELQDHSFSPKDYTEQEVTIDESYPTEHLQLLLKLGIIEILSKDPLLLHLKKET